MVIVVSNRVISEELGQEKRRMGSETQSSAKPHFVLVHGISGGAWCWYKIRCLMESSGYMVSCIDLKSAGIDSSRANSLVSFDDYNKPLIDFMSSLPDDHQVLLHITPDQHKYFSTYS